MQYTCNYVDMQHATLINSHVDIEKSIVNKIVDIMYLACREQLYLGEGFDATGFHSEMVSATDLY